MQYVVYLGCYLSRMFRESVADMLLVHLFYNRYFDKRKQASKRESVLTEKQQTS